MKPPTSLVMIDVINFLINPKRARQSFKLVDYYQPHVQWPLAWKTQLFWEDFAGQVRMQK